ncbi:glycosyltransferase family 4 protein [Ancylomarina sp. 16SWW S1-10-2]|uniref:glycosyltransferase family 4 protein n=1 Tax=Ancylomarina sp. 16SWW S1-10-2 TaxID=2499681 RepID=UPI0012AD6927|nr:glycosyltransferase family 4 protein [Ancylomarina sp. 16SWW S1-10-2]MRT93458.1 glycosyltransferase family 4 protein [Ancylomarina sp. 16SWW S1-10-2]
MKILYYTDQVYIHGGIERVLANKINYLCSQPEHEVYLITTEQKDNDFCYEVSSKLRHVDLSINYDRKLSYFHYKNLIRLPKHVKRLKRAIKDIKPDIIIQCNYAWDFYFMPFISPKTPKIKEFHSSRYFDDKRIKENGRSFRDYLNHWIESKFDGLVALNKDEAKFFFSNNVFVIPNGLSFYSKDEQLKEKIVIAAGRIAPVKGFEMLIKSWRDIGLKFPDWKLHIYGDGELEYIKFLTSLIEQYNLVHFIELRGATNNLEAKMKEASLYVMSSHTECFPMVLLEAMSCGLPVVSFDCPCGPRNIVTEGEDGLLVKNGDVNVLSEAVSVLIKDEEYRCGMSKSARQNILRFEGSIIMKEWEKLFNQLQ